MGKLEIVADNAIAQHARTCIESLPFVVGDDDLGRAQRHLALVFSSASKDLLECTKESIGRAVALSAMSGLMPGGPRPSVWLIPRWNKRAGAKEANWQIAARGYQELAFRAKVRLSPRLVNENDEFSLSYGSDEGVVHVPNLEGPGRCIGGYVFARSADMPDGFYHMTRKMIDRRRAQAQDDSTWTKWPEEMALKTLCAYAGARGLFPTDTGSRQAMAMSEAPTPDQDTPIVTAPEITRESLLNPEFRPEPETSAEERVESAVQDSKSLGIRDELETRFGLRAQWSEHIEVIEGLISEAANKRSREMADAEAKSQEAKEKR